MSVLLVFVVFIIIFIENMALAYRRKGVENFKKCFMANLLTERWAVGWPGSVLIFKFEGKAEKLLHENNLREYL